MYLAHASPLLVNTCWGEERDTQGVGRDASQGQDCPETADPPTGVLGHRTKDKREASYPRAGLKALLPHPVHPSKGQILKRRDGAPTRR